MEQKHNLLAKAVSPEEATVSPSSESSVPLVQTPKAQLPLEVPLFQQFPELARGCEVTSLAMLLNDAGVQVDKMTLAEQIKKVPFQQDGLHGSMNEGFVGDMYTFDNPGLGVYAEPIFELGQRYLPDRLINLTGKSMDNVYEQLEAGAPVWVIITSTFQLLDDDKFQTWQTPRGTMDVTYKEHSVVVTGFDDLYVYINDPFEDKPNKKLPRNDFEAAWEQMGRQAISYKA